MPAIQRYTQGTVAWGTLALFAIFAAAIPANLYFTAQGALPAWASVLIGMAVYNTSFTLWHEAAHRNVSKIRWLNNFVGIASSMLNVFPAFYRQQHDHLLHHKHLMDIEYDRTVYRARGPFFFVAFRILDEMRTYSPYDKKYGLKNSASTRSDRAGYLTVLGVISALIALGQGKAFLLCCFLPRLIILPIHVTYVCYLPHVGLGNDLKRGTRSLKVGWLKYLCYFHNFHAVHHLWPNIPWYRYEHFYRKNIPVLDEWGVEREVFPWNAPITGNDSWVTGFRDEKLKRASQS